MINKQKIKNKLLLGLKLNERERAYYLLFVATEQEMKEFLAKEKVAL